MATRKFSDWVSTDILPLPGDVIVAGDEAVVIRSGVPYRYEPIPPAYGGYYFSTPAATALAAAVPAKASGNTTATLLVGFTTTDNRLTKDTGLPSRNYLVVASISTTKAGGSATEGSFYIAKNGVVVAESQINRTLAGSTDTGAMPISSLVELEGDDYVEIFVETVNGDDITVEYGNLSATVAG